MIHELKIQNQFADAICSGKKTFELRQEDERFFNVGDCIVFRPVGKSGQPNPAHAINRQKYKITYVLRGWGLRDGYAALAIRLCGALD